MGVGGFRTLNWDRQGCLGTREAAAVRSWASFSYFTALPRAGPGGWGGGALCKSSAWSFRIRMTPAGVASPLCTVEGSLAAPPSETSVYSGRPCRWETHTDSSACAKGRCRFLFPKIRAAFLGQIVRYVTAPLPA